MRISQIQIQLRVSSGHPKHAYTNIIKQIIQTKFIPEGVRVIS